MATTLERAEVTPPPAYSYCADPKDLAVPSAPLPERIALTTVFLSFPEQVRLYGWDGVARGATLQHAITESLDPVLLPQFLRIWREAALGLAETPEHLQASVLAGFQAAFEIKWARFAAIRAVCKEQFDAISESDEDAQRASAQHAFYALIGRLPDPRWTVDVIWDRLFQFDAAKGTMPADIG